MKTVYVAPHRVYVLADDGTLLALADKAPAELPEVVRTHTYGLQGERSTLYLLGPWARYLRLLGSAMVAAGGNEPLWPGEQVRLRWHALHVPRTREWQLDAWWPCKFDRVVQL